MQKQVILKDIGSFLHPDGKEMLGRHKLLILISKWSKWPGSKLEDSPLHTSIIHNARSYYANYIAK